MGREKDVSYSVAVRNAGQSDIVLKKITINDKDYLNQTITLTPPSDKSAGGEYWAVFTAGGTVRVKVVLEDKAMDKEVTLSDKLIDNTGEGYVILLEYTGDGRGAFSTSTVGRLSVWGSSK